MKETKTFPVMVIKKDDELGIVDAVVAVMGNIDHGDDIIHSGAFTKTITERLGKFRVLDNHNTNSVTDVLGKCLLIKEIGVNELPDEIRLKYPSATGGLYTSTQFAMDTSKGKDAFNLIKMGAIDEWSIAFNVPKGKSYVSKSEDGKVIRNIKEVILYEYSPVIFAMNSATSTTSVKSEDEQTLVHIDTHFNLTKSYIDAIGFKAMSISDFVYKVKNDFYKSFPAVKIFDDEWQEWYSEYVYVVTDVYEDYVIVSAKGKTFEYYQVAFIYDDIENRFVFAEPDFWIGGNYRFSEGEKSIKAGRVLSSENISSLETVLGNITEALATITQILSNAKPKNNENDIINEKVESNEDLLTLMEQSLLEINLLETTLIGE